MRRFAAWAGAGAALAAAFAWLAASRFPAGAGEPVCTFRRVTHRACPTCGMTRALACLARGDFGASFALHPLALVLTAELVVLWLLWGRGLARGDARRIERNLPRLLAANAAAFAAVWLARLLTGTLPG